MVGALATHIRWLVTFAGFDAFLPCLCEGAAFSRARHRRHRLRRRARRLWRQWRTPISSRVAPPRHTTTCPTPTPTPPPPPTPDAYQRLPFARRDGRRSQHADHRQRRRFPPQRVDDAHLGPAQQQGRGRCGRGQQRQLHHTREAFPRRLPWPAPPVRKRPAKSVRHLHASGGGGDAYACMPSPSPSPDTSPSPTASPTDTASPTPVAATLNGIDLMLKPPFVILPIIAGAGLAIALTYWILSVVMRPRQKPLKSVAVAHLASRPDYGAGFGTPPPVPAPPAAPPSAWADTLPNAPAAPPVSSEPPAEPEAIASSEAADRSRPPSHPRAAPDVATCDAFGSPAPGPCRCARRATRLPRASRLLASRAVGL